MKIHEYQGKQIFAHYGVPTLEGKPAFSVDEAVDAAKALGGELWVIKAQIHAGGRGKGGGVKLARTLDEVRRHAEKILDMQLVTHQTGPEGQKVRRLYVESGASIAREFYLGMTLDRERSQVCVMASTEGGVEIEKVAAETPEKIVKQWVDPGVGLMPFQARALAYGLGLERWSPKRQRIRHTHTTYPPYRLPYTDVLTLRQRRVRNAAASLQFSLCPTSKYIL